MSFTIGSSVRSGALFAAVGVASLGLLCAATASDEADVREQLFKLQKDNVRLLTLATQIEAALAHPTASPACAEAAARTEQLETQLGALREVVLATQTRLDEALAEIRALRLAAGSNGALSASRPQPTPTSGGSPAETPPQPATLTEPPVSPTEAFQGAYADYSRRQYDLALDGFQRALAADPDGPLADDAQYWIGETLLAKGRTSEAIAAFQLVSSRWPQGEKRLAAEMRQGIARIEAGEREAGLALLQGVIDRHPGSPEAQSAREFIRRKGLSR